MIKHIPLITWAIALKITALSIGGAAGSALFVGTLIAVIVLHKAMVREV